jgi:transcriptional regulator with XRE-family HTH domain
MPVKSVPTMGWTKKSAAVSVLLAMEEHRRQAGLRVVQLRESKGWGQEDLAHHANVSVKTVSRFENGRHEGRRTTVRQIAQALGVDETDIVGEPPAPLGLGAQEPADDLTELVAQVRENSRRISSMQQQLDALAARLPTQDAAQAQAQGFQELLQALEELRPPETSTGE